MKLKLIERRTEIEGVESFIFEPEEPLSWKAGQYLHYVLHHEPTDDRGSDRWFTIASAPFEKNVAITTRLTGESGSSFKKKLASLVIGKSIEISHLEGDFIVENEQEEYVFMAGGIGITPFYSILKQTDHEEKKLKITLLYANRDSLIPYKKELETFAQNNPNLSVHFIIVPVRIDENLIQEMIPNMHSKLFYI